MPTKKITKKPIKRGPYTRRVSSRFMTRRELADLLGYHIETIKRKEKEDDWPKPLNLGGKSILYDRSEVEQFLQEAKS